MATTNSPDSLLARLREEGIELVSVIGPRDKDGPCLDWVGAVISVSGRTKGIPSLAQALRDGLLHAGCRHTLIAFNPRAVSPRRLEQAKYCTRHAMEAMTARLRGEEPPYLQARHRLREEAARRAATVQPGGPITPRAKFERVYQSARKADAAGDTATALIKCRAALDLLREQDLFGAGQARLVEAIESHIALLQSAK